jgi:hypothetical protein
MVVNQAFERGACFMAKNVKLMKFSTFERGPRHQDHVKMNVCIWRNAMAMQRHNDQKVDSRTCAKT